MKKQSGFTLIELIAVIVILAILAVVAVPQFVDLRVQAANATAAGVGGAISSGTSLNYARGVAAGSGASTVTGCTAAQLQALLAGGTLPTGGSITGYTIAGAAGLTSGQTTVCTITANGVTGTAAQNFTIIGCANGSCG